MQAVSIFPEVPVFRLITCLSLLAACLGCEQELPAEDFYGFRCPDGFRPGHSVRAFQSGGVYVATVLKFCLKNDVPDGPAVIMKPDGTVFSAKHERGKYEGPDLDPMRYR